MRVLPFSLHSKFIVGIEFPKRRLLAYRNIPQPIVYMNAKNERVQQKGLEYIHSDEAVMCRRKSQSEAITVDVYAHRTLKHTAVGQISAYGKKRKANTYILPVGVTSSKAYGLAVECGHDLDEYGMAVAVVSRSIV